MRLLILLLSLSFSACGARSDARSDSGTGVDGGSPDSGPRDAGGRDTGVDCPEDIASAEGTSCSVEGASCGGPCTDACSFCNVLQCESGMWRRLEAHPAPCFECGPSLRCVEGEQFCRVAHSDVGGEPDVYACDPLPAGCRSMPTCTCLMEHETFDACDDATEGQVTIEHFGG